MVTLPSGIDGSGRTRPKMFSPESRMASDRQKKGKFNNRYSAEI